MLSRVYLAQHYIEDRDLGPGGDTLPQHSLAKVVNTTVTVVLNISTPARIPLSLIFQKLFRINLVQFSNPFSSVPECLQVSNACLIKQSVLYTGLFAIKVYTFWQP